MADLEQDEGPKADLDLCTGPKDAYVVEVFWYLLFIMLCCTEHYCYVYCLLSIFYYFAGLEHELGYTWERKV